MSVDIHFPQSCSFPTRLLDQLSEILDSELFTDFTIKCQDVSLPCHKVVLAASSSVLRAMLAAGMKEANSNQLMIDAYPAKVMKSLIKYFYSGEFFISQDHLQNAIRATDYFHLEDLKSYLTTQAADHVLPGNVISWRKLAEQLNLTSIREKSKAVMKTQFLKVVAESEFLSLEYAEVVDCIQECSGTGADDIMEGSLSWVQHDTSARSSRVDDLLEHVQLDQCSPEFLKDAMDRYKELLYTRDVLAKISKALISSAIAKTMKDEPRSSQATKSSRSEQGATLMSSRKSKKRFLAFVGGINKQNGCPNQSCWLLDKDYDTKPFTQIPAHACSRNSAVCPSPVGFAVTGGVGSDRFTMYTSSTQAWSDMPNMMQKRSQHTSIYYNGLLYVIGGAGSMSYCADYYEPETTIWHKAPSLPQPMCDPEACVTRSALYVLHPPKMLLYVLNPSSGMWIKKASAPVSSYGVTLASVGDQLYVAGGWSSVCCCYTPITDSWQKLTGPTMTYGCGSLFFHNEKLYLCGGSHYKQPKTELEEFDIQNNQWKVYPFKIPQTVQKFKAFLLEVPEL